jgi:alpha-tubulin suppressor-like RCC1 family protein
MNRSSLLALTMALPLLWVTACGGGEGVMPTASQTRDQASALRANGAPAPEVVVSSAPSDGAINVSAETDIRISFSQSIVPSSVGPATVRLTGPQGLVQGNFDWSPTPCGGGVKACDEEARAPAGVFEVIFRPDAPLQGGQLYVIEVAGVAIGISHEPSPRYRASFTTRFEQAQPRDLSAGGGSSCGVVTDAQHRARVKCWGINSGGQLGLDDSTDRGDVPGQMGANLPFAKLPLSPTDGRNVVQVTVGDGHACVLLDDASVMCWGDNQYGQLGRGDQVTPVGVSWNPMSKVKSIALALEAGDKVISISAGGFSTCALTELGRVHCWGRNERGELGLGDTQHHGDQPGEIGRVELGQERRAFQLSMGQWHRCALLDDGALKCWGRNDSGQLGLGDRNDRGASLGDMGDHLPAVDLGSNRRAVQVSAGALHTCALLNTGQVACWGSNEGGRLGLGTFTSNPALAHYAYGDEAGEMGDALPTVALRYAESSVHAVSVGFNHSCAHFASGKLQCWGLNYVGQLGLGDTNVRGDQAVDMGNNLPFVTLGSGPAVKAISAGGSFACVRLEDGSIKCWGGNTHGQLGLGHVQNQGDAAGEMETLLSVSLQ